MSRATRRTPTATHDRVSIPRCLHFTPASSTCLATAPTHHIFPLNILHRSPGNLYYSVTHQLVRQLCHQLAQVLATQLRTPGCSTCTPIYPVYTHRSQPKMAPPVRTQPRHDDIPACSGSSCVVPTFLFASLCQAGRQNSLPRILLASCLENKSFPSPSHSAQLQLLNLIYYWNQFWMAGLESKSN